MSGSKKTEAPGRAASKSLGPETVAPEVAATGIAVVGMACRFPGAKNIDELWDNLSQGKESITFFTDDELKDAGVDPSLLEDSSYVKAGALLDDVDKFDAGFFDVASREAVTMDPQHRIFLECAWEALEDAGYDPATYDGLIGVFAGSSLNTYYLFNLAANPVFMTTPEGFQAYIGNDKDYLATRISYKLNLRGPSVTVQTACSTSMTAIHVACQSLLSGECDIAMAGGVSVKVPQKMGYFYGESMPFSVDGHCRTFDADAKGTVFGSGAGIVVLKRLEDALEENDHIVAVIRGSAINNDGSEKIGFTAPGIDGQSEVIAEALAISEIDPETIGYVEAHGTGTPLGDPIEIDALTQVYRSHTDKKQFCGIGSVKSNFGHLETAAGIAGFIKAALMLEKKELVPSLHFKKPNPEIDFPNSPFYVCNEPAAWESNGAPRRAAISSFGIGGTNVHAVLEEAPAPRSSETRRDWHLLTLTARSATALETVTERLAHHLETREDLDLADVAHTLHVGRSSMDFRRIAICRDRADAVEVLKSLDPKRILSTQVPVGERSFAFMFPGGGAQYVNMGRDLYECEPKFRETLDYCAEHLKPHMGLDLRDVLYPSAEKAKESAELLQETPVALPTLFSAEYALAQLLIGWGFEPSAMVGHSNGEFVAACLAGVLSLEDALELVTARAQLMQKLPEGSMVSIPMGAEDVEPLLKDPLSIAAINSPSACVVSGPTDKIEALVETLEKRDLDYRRLHIAVGAHSVFADAILDEFISIVERFTLNEPKIPFVSNVTGTWIKPEEATDPQYWARHLRHTVRFQEAVTELLQDPARIVLEVGPGQGLSSLARQNVPQPGAGHTILPTTRRRSDEEPDLAVLLDTVGRAWMVGGVIDWASFHEHEHLRRLRLPSYPFERQRYWIEAKGGAAGASLEDQIEDWVENEGAEVVTSTAAAAQGRRNLLNPYVAPSNDLEEEIAKIWRKFFGIEEVGVHDNFFELGGTSLLATQLINSVQKAFKIELSVPEFLSAATIGELGTKVAELTEKKKESRAAQALARLQELSEEEIQQMLSEKKRVTT